MLGLWLTLCVSLSIGCSECCRFSVASVSHQTAAVCHGSCDQALVQSGAEAGDASGVCHHANTGGRALRQEHHYEVKSTEQDGANTHSEMNEWESHGSGLSSTCCCLVFCSAQQESTKKGNMKRENKAYSFKEQIIELELQEVREIQQMIRSN